MSPGRPQLTKEDLYMSGLATRLNFESSKLHCLTTVYFFALKGDSSLRSSMPLPWPLIAKPPLSSVRADASSSDSERRSLRLPPHQSQSPAVSPNAATQLAEARLSGPWHASRCREGGARVLPEARYLFPLSLLSVPASPRSNSSRGNGHVALRKQHFREKRLELVSLQKMKRRDRHKAGGGGAHSDRGDRSRRQERGGAEARRGSGNHGRLRRPAGYGGRDGA